MKLGFLTAPFPETPLTEVADWAAGAGFEVLEIACWPRTSGPTRRYAGTSHIDVANLSAAQAKDIRGEIEAKGLAISGLGFYPNPLHPDPEHRAAVIGHLRLVIEAAEKMDVGLVNTFMGGDGAKNQDQNWATALEVWPDIVRFAQDHGRRITLENCPMLFSHDEWPGGHNIATTPRMWRRILEQWSGTIGLNFDPSHLVLQMIDMRRFLVEFAPHILHFQAKDLMIDPRRALRARRVLDGHGLADPAHPGPRAGRLGPRLLRALPRRLRGRLHHRARGPPLRGDRREGQAGLPHRPRRPPAVLPVAPQRSPHPMSLSIADLTERDIAKTIDHSLLRPELDDAFVDGGCRLAAKYDVASVCVRPADVRRATAILAGTDVAVGTTVGFPHGNHETATKVFEARRALDDGATELDMVIRIGALRSGRDQEVGDDIRAVVDVAHAAGAIVKVIFENAYLTDDEKVRACRLTEAAGGDFVKTSTGFAPSGATHDDLRLMRANTSPHIGVKAAGGVRTLDALIAVMELGVTRIGATATETIILDFRARRAGEAPVSRLPGRGGGY